ncbi:site-specific integrase [Microbacterium esteraromaticum]|uniref:site-specific integrase n=1 Tax=Microbacterium esteraromaticum TaxID=57043 RepID=UPI001A8DC9B3|nr:site-specific integrase [Microbacterium esteraromaticum]
MAKPRKLHTIRAVAFDTISGHQSRTVGGRDGLPIDPIEEFLQTLRARGLSLNTVGSYARHLSLYWRWLGARQLTWDAVTFILLTEFVGTYRAGVAPLESRNGGARKRTSVQAVGAAVKEFYGHHQLEGHVPGLQLTRERASSGRTAHKFLAHVERKKRKAAKNRLTEGMASEAPHLRSSSSKRTTTGSWMLRRRGGTGCSLQPRSIWRHREKRLPSSVSWRISTHHVHLRRSRW